MVQVLLNKHKQFVKNIKEYKVHKLVEVVQDLVHLVDKDPVLMINLNDVHLTFNSYLI
jgi:hypothetical protein